MKRFFAGFGVLLAVALSAAQTFTLTVLHTDDLHGRLEPVKVGNGTYGGYARQLTLVRRYMSTDENPVLLSGGDTFQGTLYFTVYQGLADLFFMNLMGYMGMAVGNHEFDLGPAPLGVFARGAHFPVLACNIDVEEEPELKGVIKPHAVISVGGERIGLIGAVTPDLPAVSSPGPNVKMLDLMSSIAKSVEALEKDGVNKIVLLSHLGYPLEKEVAAKVRGLDIIVGGHSHTLLGTFQNPDFPESEGPYPTVVDNPSGARTLLVAAWEWGKVLGRIKVDFDPKGVITAWREAQPIPVDESVPEDRVGKSAVVAFSKPIEALRRSVVSSTESGLDGARETVRRQETAMGNVIADAMLEATAKQGVVLALINGGGIRTGIDAGDITFEEVINVQPFNNRVIVLDLTGRELLDALKYGVDGIAEGKGAFLHVSRGFAYTMEPAGADAFRFVEATLNSQPIDPAKTYRVAMNSFMASGGDGFEVFSNAKGTRTDTGLLDVDVLVDYLKRNPGIAANAEGRIRLRR